MKITLDLTAKEIANMWDIYETSRFSGDRESDSTSLKLCNQISSFMYRKGIDKFKEYLDDDFFTDCEYICIDGVKYPWKFIGSLINYER